MSSDKASASYLLPRPEEGQMAILAAGRPLEALEANPGALSLRIRNQKGFVKSAWITGEEPARGQVVLPGAVP